MREVIDRETAQRRGLNRYYTDKPCKSGHLAERFTVSGSCVECKALQGSGRVKTITVALRDLEYIQVVAEAAARVTPDQIARCQTDADFNLWIDGLWTGRWNTRAELVAYMWGWLIDPDRKGPGEI